jgi:glycerol-3-phosphate dehydrogenase
MNPSARATIWDLTSRRLDVLVVGGGATGAGIAREAALRGLTVALVDRYDFGGGTSSRSSRLIHGGLRYLEQRDWKLVKESLAERRILLTIAPHLVRPLEFLFPVFHTDRVGRWKLELGLTVYDLLALGGNVRRHRSLSKRAVLDQEPMLRARGLAGGSVYWDAQCDDARLTLVTIQSAVRAGAIVANYTCVTAFDSEPDRLTGAILEDQLTGAQATATARVIVNATGPWTDRIRRFEDPTVQPLIAPTRGSHVMVPRARIGHHHAITFLSPIDGRVMFVLPWGDRSYIGTTDSDDATSPDAVTPTEDDVLYLLRSVNALFPEARLAPEDVSFCWSGLRPLLIGSAGRTPSERSRDYAITVGRKGLLTVTGGKLTTYRRVAVDVVDRIAERLGTGGPPTDPLKTRSATEALPGGQLHDVQDLFSRGVRRGFPEPIVAHLIGQYGAEATAVYDLLEERPDLRDPIHSQHPAVGAQVVHAVRAEYARRLDDVLFRRLSLAHETGDAGVEAAPGAAAIMARELGWDETRRNGEVERYRAQVDAIPRGGRYF